MTWPTGAPQTFAHESNADVDNVGGTILDGDKQSEVYDLLERIQIKVGPDTDTSAATSHEGRLKTLEAAPPSADATSIQGTAVDPTAPADQQVLVYDSGTGTLLWQDQSGGGMADPFTTPGQLLYRGASAPAALAIGSPRQILVVNTAGDAPEWITAPYIADPSGAPNGAVLVKNTSGVWSYVAPGTSGYALTSNGVGAAPSYQVIPGTPPGSGITAPASLRVGSIIQYDGSDFIKLDPGTAGQVLTAHGDNNVSGSLLTWTTPSSGGSTPMTTLGDLITGDTGGTPIRLGIGSTGKVLTVVAGVPAWATPAWVNPMTTLDDIIIGGASGAAARLAKGSNGQVLTISSSGHVVWQNSASGFADPETTIGDMIYRNGSNVTARLAIGSTNQVLTVVGGVPAWAAPATSGHVIQDEGTPLTARSALNFVGDGAVATDDSGNNASLVTIPGWYNQLKVDGTVMTQRHNVKLISGTGVTLSQADNSGADQSEVTISASGGGGGGSALSRTVNGLILWHDYSQVPDHALTTTPDALGYAVRTTYDHGTGWAFRSGLLTVTTSDNPSDCSNLTLSQLYGVFQTRFYTPAVGSTQAGPEWAVQSGADTRMLYLVRNGDASVYDRTAGSWGTPHTGTNPSGMIQGQWIAAKVRWTATQVLSTWVNRVLLDSAFTYSAHPGTGGFGLIAVSAANTVFKDYAIYSSTILTVDGLSGTQAFRILDAGGRILAASSTQSGGSATIDLATVIDPPVPLVIEVLTATGGSVVTGGRYPAEGVAGDVWPGDTWHLS